MTLRNRLVTVQGVAGTATLSDVNQEISTHISTRRATSHSDGPIPSFTVQLSPTPRGARLARLLAREQLRSWGLPLDPAELIVAELAANAVTHGRVAGRDFRLTLYAVGDTLPHRGGRHAW